MSVIIDGSAGVTTNAGGSVNPSTNVDGINFSCRAFVNFDGTKDTTGATSTANTNRLIRASGNVTSVLRNATGDYTITFTTAMTDANYCISTLPNRASAGTAPRALTVRTDGTVPTSAACRLEMVDTSSTSAVDQAFCYAAFFR